jgi:C4-dicarboxylate-specific signal transduction histidine kinase
MSTAPARLRRTLRDGNRASDVITRLRTLFNKKEVNVEPLDMNETVREVIALSLTELQINRVILREEFAEGLPLVKGDRVQLQQVILNLLRNASDAMNSVENWAKQLLLKTESDGEHVRLSVQDSGVGFDPEVADQLFE